MSKIFVGSLPWKVDSALLRERFEQYGQVEQAIVLTDRETGRSRGFGFVTYTNAEDAQRAIDEANDSELEGRTIRVASAAER
ncbi:RRM domain RNA-binding protein, partial [Martensiomyces pterosporus]